MSSKRPFIALVSVLSSFLLGPMAASHAQDTELQDIAGELAQDQTNPILLMQQQMLSHKHRTTAPETSNWRRLQRRTNLSREVLGGMAGGGRRNTFAQSVALLTGQRAIDESLQLGSIGINRTTVEQSTFVSIDDITQLEIESHPWAEMITQQTFPIPELAKLVPRDMLFVHMQQPEKFLQFEKILQQQSDLFGDVYNLGRVTGLKKKMMQRLGIPDADALIVAVDEMAFVSDDLSFLPGTDYALILKMVNTLAEKGFDLLVSHDAIYRKVGDYLVVATEESLLTRIQDALAGTGAAMSVALDYHYALTKMEPRRDGLIYLSEAFIRKLTGPAYRINSRRRNTILAALETLQYSVFAYRRISGRWPSSIQEMVDDNYIVADAIYAPQDYRIDKGGRVSHQTWGTLWQVTPIGRVPLDNITAMEKTNYERFSQGYQSFFREFFDPVGVAYTISDQLYLHTLILPLIDNSDYRDLQSFFSGQPGEASFFFAPDRLGAINVAATFSVDDLLVRSRLGRGRSDDAGDAGDVQRLRQIYEAENEISENMLDEPLAPGERLLDFIGNEVFFGVGEKNSFSISNIADIDIWFGLKLKDRVRAEEFFRRLWQKIAGEMDGRGAGMFQLSSSEPLSNEYQGQKFYLLPTGFVNIFYVFFDDSFYVTISQLSMNRLIDARIANTPEGFPTHLQRGFAHIGTAHNIVAAMDLEEVASFELGRELNFWERRVAEQFAAHHDALKEALTLAKILPNHDGTLANAEQYYRDLPHAFYGAKFVADDGKLYLNAGQQRLEFGEISSASRGSALNELLKSSLSPEKLRTRVRAFRAATLGLSFLPDGLEVKLSIGNPNISVADARFSLGQPDTGEALGTMRNRWVWIAIALALLVLAVFIRNKWFKQRP